MKTERLSSPIESRISWSRGRAWRSSLSSSGPGSFENVSTRPSSPSSGRRRPSVVAWRRRERRCRRGMRVRDRSRCRSCGALRRRTPLAWRRRGRIAARRGAAGSATRIGVRFHQSAKALLAGSGDEVPISRKALGGEGRASNAEDESTPLLWPAILRLISKRDVDLQMGASSSGNVEFEDPVASFSSPHDARTKRFSPLRRGTYGRRARRRAGVRLRVRRRAKKPAGGKKAADLSCPGEPLSPAPLRRLTRFEYQNAVSRRVRQRLCRWKTCFRATRSRSVSTTRPARSARRIFTSRATRSGDVAR